MTDHEHEHEYDPNALPVPHGYALSADRRALIHARPPDGALRWAAHALGARRIVRVQPLKGGSSSAIHAITTDDGQRVVMRRWVLPLDDPDDADVPERETEALQIMQSVAAVPTPELIAADLTGEDTGGTQATLMSLVRGRIDWAPKRDQLDGYLRRLVEPLLHISDAVLPAAGPGAIHAYRPYEWDRPVGGPPWTELPPSLWQRAAEVYLGPPPTTERRFIHRDYHPGNVLWRRRRITGVVDWASASVGSPEVDVGHCRMNLQGHFSQAIADRFLALWLAMSGRDSYDPYWDLAAVMTTPEDYDLAYNHAVDEFVGAAMRRL